MFLSCALEDVKNMIRNCGAGTATVGILMADYRQDESREYILNYLSEFDRRSGRYIDFYIPGYQLKSGIHFSFLWHFNNPTHVDTIVEFDSQAFERAIEEAECILGVEYTYNPMLILVDIDSHSENCFRSKIVIELDDNESHSARRAGILFNEIFRFAKQDNDINHISRELERCCLSRSFHRIVEHLLQHEYISACGEVSKAFRYRIR